ncbi:MAG TPA: hypothetical protein VH370_19735 [Humisphaera sp.]|jgi:hypothetical protein|nr:hypothetical protein [Humisphaera sp.]
MPQIVGARTTATEKGQEMDRATVERAEQIRAGRERLLKLRVSAGSGVSAAPGIGAGAADEKAQIGDDISDAEALLAAARHETALAVQQAKMAWRTALICAFCVAFGIGAGAWAGVKVVRKINRDTVEMERVAAEARTQRELSGIIAEERDMLRADLAEAREAKARIEGQLIGQSGAHAPTVQPVESDRAQQ